MNGTRMLLQVLRTELLQLVRDRRAFFLAVVLPMLLYPFLFAGMERLDQAAERSVEDKVVRVGHDLQALPAELRARMLAEWSSEDLRLEAFEMPGGLIDDLLAQNEDEARESWEHVSANLVVVARLLRDEEPGAPRGAAGRPRYVLEAVSDGSDTLSRAASERIAEVTEDLDAELAHERLVAVAGGDPAAALGFEAVDVAPAEDASGLALGKLLPLLAVLMLISGGSFAALGAFAGEREAGTLETLFVQPVDATTLSTGKFLAVFVTALLALVGNAASFLVCLAFGIGDASFLPGFTLGATGARLALGLVLFLPTALLLCALLCWISAKAKSFREGQHYILPLILFSIAPAGLAMQDRVELTPSLAVLPIAGSALVLRDALAGSLSALPAALSVAAGGLWAWLALRRVADTLDAERLFATPATAAERNARQAAARTANAFAIAAVLLVYVVGGRLQAWRLVPGLALTLAVLLPALSLACALRLRTLTGETLVELFAMRTARLSHLLGAALLAPALAMLSQALFRWQSVVLPVPEAFQLFEVNLSTQATVLLLCLAPGLFEELAFRGVFLSGQRRDWSTGRTLLWQAITFGAVHASIYRLLPTAAAGAVLAAVRLRTRSLWPCVVLHASHNAWIALVVGSEEGTSVLATIPEAGVLALGALGFVLLLRRPPSP